MAVGDQRSWTLRYNLRSSMLVSNRAGSADAQLQVTVVALNQIWKVAGHPAWMWSETWLVTGGMRLWDVRYCHSSFMWSQVRFCWGWLGASTASTETWSTFTSVDLFCHVWWIPMWFAFDLLDIFWSLTFLDHFKIALVWCHRSDVLPACPATGVPKGH